MLTYLIICPLLFLAGFVDAIAGGGGLISLPAYMVAGLPAHAAIATNKLSSSMGTTVATIQYIRAGYMRWNLCVPAIITALAGSWGGAKLSLFLDENVLKIMMLVILPFIAFYVLRTKNLESNNDKKAFSIGATVALCCLISLAVGVYDGLYGPGTGTFLMLLFAGVCRLSLQDSAGATKAINLTTNITALVVFLVNGAVLIPLGLAAGVCNMAGNYLGSRCFAAKGAAFVKPLILVVLVIFFVKIIWEFMA
ncbi:MAG: sulfite exporter TauE/SafE family protein [Bacillota bacterium]|jgi:uncharacterized membrane protein YfcA